MPIGKNPIVPQNIFPDKHELKLVNMLKTSPNFDKFKMISEDQKFPDETLKKYNNETLTIEAMWNDKTNLGGSIQSNL